MLSSPTRVVVTGAAGFIGSHLCERLLKDPKVKATRLIALDRDLPAGVVQCLGRSGLDIASYSEVANIQLAPRGTGTGRLRLLIPRD